MRKTMANRYIVQTRPLYEDWRDMHSFQSLEEANKYMNRTCGRVRIWDNVEQRTVSSWPRNTK